MQNNEFKFQVSRIYIGLLSAILIISLTVISLFPLLYFFIGFVLLLFYSWYLIATFGLMQGKKIVTGLKFLDDTWFIDTKEATYIAKLNGESVVTRYISILTFKVAKKSRLYSCVIFPDSLPADEYRQFVSWIKMQS